MKSKNLIIIIAHQDDEICLFNRIHHFKNKNNIYVFYLTSGLDKILNTKNTNYRNCESIKVLKKLGVLEKNIIFLGDKPQIRTQELYDNLFPVYKKVVNNLKKIKGKKIIYTHALEGGHLDHDCCYYISRQLIKNSKQIETIYQFPSYHSKNLPFIFYRVLNPIKENGKLYKKKYDFFQRFKFIYLLFFYKSQLFESMVWVGMYPFLIFHFLFSKSDVIQKVDLNLNNIRRPHEGPLLYEKRSYKNYIYFEKKIKIFLKKFS